MPSILYAPKPKKINKKKRKLEAENLDSLSGQRTDVILNDPMLAREKTGASRGNSNIASRSE